MDSQHIPSKRYHWCIHNDSDVAPSGEPSVGHAPSKLEHVDSVPRKIAKIHRPQPFSPDVIAHIAAYHSKHLQLRLVNSQFDIAVRELHSHPLYGCTRCRCSTNFTQFVAARTRLPFITNWHLSGESWIILPAPDGEWAWKDYRYGREVSLPGDKILSGGAKIAKITVVLTPRNYEILHFITFLAQDTASVAVVLDYFKHEREHHSNLVLEYLHRLPHRLVSFVADQWCTSHETMETLFRFPFTQLTCFCLTAALVGDQELQLLSESPMQSTLTYLSLAGNQFSSQGFITHFCQNSHFARLKSLNISWNPSINDSCMIALSQSRCIAHLEALSVRFCSVSDVGIQSLVSSPLAPNLKTIDSDEAPETNLLPNRKAVLDA